MFDIFIAIQKIKKVSSQYENVEKLLYDFMVGDSVIREFEIIGEASKYLIRDKLIESFIEDNHYLDFVIVSLKKLSKC